MERRTLFADILIPVSLKGYFTYRVPFVLNDLISPLLRVMVPFGNKRVTTGLVINVHENPPTNFEARYIEDIIDEKPVITTEQIQFWQWLASYYICSEGEVMQAALPSSLKLQGETYILLTELAENCALDQLNNKEIELLYLLQEKKKVKLNDLPKLLNSKTFLPTVKSLWQNGILRMEDEVLEKFKPLEIEYISLAQKYHDEEALSAIIDKLSKAPKQLDLLLGWLDLSDYLKKELKPVTKTDLIKRSGSTLQTAQQLIKKGIFYIEKKQISRLSNVKAKFETMPVLNLEQQNALSEIHIGFLAQKIVLLHGVTSSGKTELYISLIQEKLKAGQQVLYLLPEIALTAQIILRLQAYFGALVQVYHSKFSENERAEVWNRLLEQKDKPMLILGARSAIFLPFSNLGLVIVDEEHESSYKQNDPAPRYQGRDAAIKLATIFHANVLLGSATPCLESYFNTQIGKYVLVKLTTRYGNALMPEIIVNDLRIDKKKKTMQGVFSNLLLQAIVETKKHERQSIMFQNRRGFSPVLECNDCGWTPECIHCDISLTYHKRLNQLRCHYCGYNINVVPACTSCGSTNLKTMGFGTEKIEEDLHTFVPEANVQRLDLDTTRSKYAYHHILEGFHQKHIDVLVGTQMVTKGLDFDAVDLAGILNADSMLNYPDFRASERAFQLMLQVSGRAGRRDKQGKVIIQTHQPEHPIIIYVVNHDYMSFYNSELAERKTFLYPPFVRLILFYVKHKEADQASFSASYFASQLKQYFDKYVLGPEDPPVSRVRNMFIKRIMLKVPNEYSIVKVKKTIEQLALEFQHHKIHKGARLNIDVDPA